MEGNSLLYVTTLSGLVAIGIVFIFLNYLFNTLFTVEQNFIVPWLIKID